MKIINQLLVIVCIFCFHNADSLVVSKFDSNTMSSYLKLVRYSNQSNIAVEEFFERNVTEYCYQIRIFEFLDSGVMPIMEEENEQLIEPNYRNNTRNLLEIEQNQGEKQIRKFKIKNINQTLNFHSFYCLNLDKELTWLITPAFIPDSNFLFEVEPSFRFSALRQINDGNKINVRLIGIIDTSGSIISRNISNYKNSNSKDKLCDLNRIIQNRTCSLVSDVMRLTVFRYPLSSLKNDLTASHTYQDQSTENDRICRKPTHPVREIDFHEMLYCSIHTKGGYKESFYVSSNVLSDPLNVFYCTQWEDNRTFFSMYSIPLLKHLKLYNELLGESDI